MTKQVVKVFVTEYERGWGQRPDGAFYFKTLTGAQKWLDERMKEREGMTHVPDCYDGYSPPMPAEMSDQEYEASFKDREFFWRR